MNVTWDMDTIAKVTGLWMELSVDDIVLAAAATDVRAATRQRLAASLVAEAHTFGVDAHLGDIDFAERRRDDDRGVAVHARWNPATCVVELIGGEQDGTLIHVPHVGDPLRVARSMVPSFTASDSYYPAMTVDVYEVAGWRETERRWVYKISEPTGSG